MHRYERTVDAISNNADDMNRVRGSDFTDSEQFRLLRLPTRGKHPCRKVVFEIEGHEESVRDPIDISNSCFVAIVERFKFNEESEESLPLTVGTPQQRGRFGVGKGKPLLVAPSLYYCQNIAQQIIWRYDDNDKMVLSHSLDRFEIPRSSSNGRNLIKSLQVTDRLSLQCLTSEIPGDQRYITDLAKVKVYWAI